MGIAATGSKHAWVIGYESSRGIGFVLQWNGRTWTEMTPLPAGYLPEAVPATGPTNVWVFSSVQDLGVEATRWTGHRWQRIPMPAGEDIGAGDAAVSSATDAWYSDGQQLLHWNGTGWTTQHTGAHVTLANSPSGQVWQAVAGHVGTHTSMLVVRRWNGRKWLSVSVPHLRVIGVPGISLPSADNVAILTRAPTAKTPNAGHLLLWNGHRWRSTGLPWFAGTTGGFTAVGHGRAWVGPAALWDSRQWLERAVLIAYYLAGIPGTTATWAVGYSKNSHGSVTGSIWLNGKL